MKENEILMGGSKFLHDETFKVVNLVQTETHSVLLPALSHTEAHLHIFP